MLPEGLLNAKAQGMNTNDAEEYFDLAREITE
jgi:hypothetical protein